MMGLLHVFSRKEFSPEITELEKKSTIIRPNKINYQILISTQPWIFDQKKKKKKLDEFFFFQGRLYLLWK